MKRIKIGDAAACFILGNRFTSNENNPKTGPSVNRMDYDTIMRCLAVKAYAPSVPVFAQLFNPQNYVHLSHLEDIQIIGWQELSMVCILYS